MRVTDQDTGKTFSLDLTDELKRDLAAHYDSSCKHPDKKIRQRKNKAGTFHFYQQCLTCGAPYGSAIKRTPEIEGSPAWDECLEKQYSDARETGRQSIYQTHVRKQKSGAEGFKREYDLYLASPEWRVKRSKVLKRANGICEGCLERKATQVHHVTYKHVPNEFMFELIAVCADCHERLHANEHEGEPSRVIDDLEAEWADCDHCDGCRWGSEQDGRRWCVILDQFAADALAPGGECGPKHASFEPLK
jgi:hypothetical protein